MTGDPPSDKTLNERLFAAGLLAELNAAVQRRDRLALEQILDRVAAAPRLAGILLGEDILCGFCGDVIWPTESDALHIALTHLWGQNGSAPARAFNAHFGCASDYMSSAKLKIDLASFGRDTA
jgi:hypothetical protein